MTEHIYIMRSRKVTHPQIDGKYQTDRDRRGEQTVSVSVITPRCSV